jgi:hypothetical protein
LQKPIEQEKKKLWQPAKLKKQKTKPLIEIEKRKTEIVHARCRALEIAYGDAYTYIRTLKTYINNIAGFYYGGQTFERFQNSNVAVNIAFESAKTIEESVRAKIEELRKFS